MQNLSDFIMKCAIFEEHSSSCVVYSRFGGTLFPVSMIDGADGTYVLSFNQQYPYLGDVTLRLKKKRSHLS